MQVNKGHFMGNSSVDAVAEPRRVRSAAVIQRTGHPWKAAEERKCPFKQRKEAYLLWALVVEFRVENECVYIQAQVISRTNPQISQDQVRPVVSLLLLYLVHCSIGAGVRRYECMCVSASSPSNMAIQQHPRCLLSFIGRRLCPSVSLWMVFLSNSAHTMKHHQNISKHRT